jgi:protein-tyrosine-phosphatase
MAEGIFNLICEKGNLPHRASSCGIAAFSCAPASRYAIVAAKELGVDMIYCMSEQHAKAVLSVCPNACDKIFVFNPPVPDPFGGGIDEYRNCAASLEKAIEKLIADIGVRK